MTMADWLFAIGALAGGVIIGSIASKIASAAFSGEQRPAALRSSAKSLAALFFWVFVAIGLVVALGAVDPAALDDLPRDFIALLPKLMVAAIIVIGANVLSSVVETAMASSLSRLPVATAAKINQVVKAVIVLLAVLIAVRQIGVDTTVVNMALGAVFFAIAGSFTLLVGFGGRAVTGEVASSRAVRRLISEGDRIQIGDLRGSVVTIHPTAVELLADNGVTELVPSSKFTHETFSILRTDAT